MVGLNPGKFYGRLLPRPRVYCDAKFSDARVDPPESVNAALLEWAGGANWKMGGTSAKRNRMSGKIEGRMTKLRAMEESEDEESLPLKEVNEKKPLSFGKKSASSASSLERPVTPIERVLASPQTKRKKIEPLRSISSEPENDEEKVEPLVKSRVRKSRKDKDIESNVEDDDVLESFPQNMGVKDATLTGITRRSGRLNSSPRTSQSRRNSASRNSRGSVSSPVTRKRKLNDKDSICESYAPI